MTPTPVAGAVVCPLCQTEAPQAIQEVLARGGHWECPRCQQNWSERRMRTVAAYTAWGRAQSAATTARSGTTGHAA